MPGTILVSVLEFMGLPLSSSTFIKVSMGKREYQISEKGEFSFPLTSLRDDFIVKLQDADGNEISRIGFLTKSIVEKGVWEDIFPLGPGHLHLKLQFILNDEERDKIRVMRQSALKKKHDELLNSNLRNAESGSTSVGNAAITFNPNDEVSGSQSSQESPKKYLQLEAASQVKCPLSFQNDKKEDIRNVVGAQPDQLQLNSNSAAADPYKETLSTEPVSQAVDLTQLQHKGFIRKPPIHSPSAKDSHRAINSEEVEILFKSSKQNDVAMNNLIESNLEEDSLQYSENQSPLGRAPSSVRKMINAFERQSGLAQDLTSHIKPLPTKYESSLIETKASSKTHHSGKEDAGNKGPVGFLQGRAKGAYLARESQQALAYTGESREQINSFSCVSYNDTGQLKELSTIKILNKQTHSNSRNKFKVAHRTDTEENKYNEDLMRASTFETVTVSRKMPEKYSDRNHPSNLFSSRQDSRNTPSKEEKRKGNASKGSSELCIQRDSPHKLNSVIHFEDNYYSLESSGAWIFPDELRKFCITTGGKNVMGLLESLVIKHKSHQRSLDFSILENEQNAEYTGIGTEVSKHEKIDESEESNSKKSVDNGDEISRRPIKQNEECLYALSHLQLSGNKSCNHYRVWSVCSPHQTKKRQNLEVYLMARKLNLLRGRALHRITRKETEECLLSHKLYAERLLIYCNADRNWWANSTCIYVKDRVIQILPWFSVT